MSRRGWVLFSAMCLLWGIPYLFIKIAVEELTPAQLVLLRTGLAAVLLVPYAAVRGQLRPVLRRWRPLLLFAAVELAVPWYLLASAERTLPSSLTGLLIAAVPLVAAAVSRVTGAADRLDASRLAGLGLGLAGVSLLVGLDVSGGDRFAVAELAVVVACYATGPMIATRFLADVPATGVTALALLATALVFAPAGPGLQVPSGPVVVAVLVLSVFCTVAALLAFLALIAEVGPNRALVITFVNPAVALTLGIVVLSEPLTAGALVGFPLVLLGCVLATRRDRPARLSPPAGPVDGGAGARRPDPGCATPAGSGAAPSAAPRPRAARGD